MELTIVEQNGWKKPVRLEKAVTRVGSAPGNDIQLASPNILGLHLQIIYSPDSPASCKVINFGPALSFKFNGTDAPIAPYATQDVRDGDEISLDEYHLIFRLPLSGGVLASSRQIAATFSLQDAVLQTAAPMVAFLRLKNLGTNPACLFQVDVSGFPESCFQVDPMPLLYQGGEEDVRIRFFHRGNMPPAGFQSVTITVTAPASYPGEQVVIQQGMYVTPSLKTAFTLSDDMPVTDTVAPQVEESSLAPSAAEPALLALDETNRPDFFEPAPEPALELEQPVVPPPPLPAAPPKDLSTAKVVRNPSETYWDE